MMGEADTVTHAIGPIQPVFIVSSLTKAVEFYERYLGFEVVYSSPEENPFFSIVRRGSVRIHLKEIDSSVPPRPNSTRHEWAPWDAFVYSEDPDTLADELASRGLKFHRTLGERDDGLRGFETRDADGYVLFFGRPTT